MIDRAQVVAALPQYEVGPEIGRGAHGQVFTARHRKLGSAHAVKAVVVGDDERDAAGRFLTEARVLTSLDHPHIVRVNEYAERDSVLLLVMEHLGGGTLTQRIGRPVAPEVASAWMLAVAEALSVAHGRGVVHRDIKPANLLFTNDGLLKVGDFAIAKLFAGTDASASAVIIGTPRYIAPEQISGGRIGPATDLYALGMTFYELLTARSPFPVGLTMPGLLHHHLSVPPAPLENTPPALSALVLRLLAKDPAARPASAREFASALLAAGDQDLGRGWVTRSGVPLRIDGTLLHRDPAEAAPVFPPAAAEAPTVRHHVPPAAARPATDRRSPRPVLIGGLVALTAVVLAGGALFATHYASSGAADAVPAAQKSVTSPTVSADPAGTPLATYRMQSSAKRLVTNRDASRIAWVDTGDTFWLWPSTAETARRPLGSAGVQDVYFSPTTDLLVTLRADGTMQKWRWEGAADEQPGDSVRGPGDYELWSVASDFQGDSIAAGGANGVIRIYEFGKLAKTLGRWQNADIADLSYSPDRSRLVSGDAQGLRLWDLDSGDQLKAMPGGEAYQTAFSPDGSRLVGAGSGGIRLFSGQTGETIATITPPSTTQTVAVGFTADSTKLVTATGNVVRWWDATTGKQVGAEFAVHTPAPVDRAIISPDGTRLVTVVSNTLSVWTLPQP